jgi:hypothetical protein
LADPNEWIALPSRAGLLGAGHPTAAYFAHAHSRCVGTVDGWMNGHSAFIGTPSPKL